MTVGLFYSGSTVQNAKTGEDSSGKLLFRSSSVMMREKVNVYKQFAQVFLGDADASFYSPFDSTATADRIDEALFISFKRLFHRDGIKRETFAMKFYQSASRASTSNAVTDTSTGAGGDGPNLRQTSESGSVIFTDIGAGTAKNTTFGGTVGAIVDSADTSRKVGLLWYERGTAVFDLKKIISGSQKASGSIDAMNVNGTQVLGGVSTETPNAKFIPDFFVSASMDDIIDHLASTRFGSGSQTAITFQNNTLINSALFFCRAEPGEANYSSNPTYTDSTDRINVIEVGSEDIQQSFTFVTTVGLYNAANELLAVGKLSRPIEKNSEKDLSIRIRLDFAKKYKYLHVTRVQSHSLK